MGLSHLELKKASNDPNETLICRFEDELIGNMLKDYVKVRDDGDDGIPEFQFRELEEELPFKERLTEKISFGADLNDEGEKDEFKERSNSEKEEDEGVTSSDVNDDKKSQGIMTLEQIKQE